MMKIVDARTREGRRELEALLKSRRGASPDFATLKLVLPVVEDVLRRGEPALSKYVERFDGPGARGQGSKRAVSSNGKEGKRPGGTTAAAPVGDQPYYRSKKILIDPRREKLPRVDRSFAAAFRLARQRIEAYHRKQLSYESVGFSFKDSLGVSFVEKPVPLDSVGVYVPGGRAFYPSSAPDGRRAGAGRRGAARRRRDAAQRVGVEPGAALGGARAQRRRSAPRGRGSRHRGARLRRGSREDRGPGQPLRRGGETHRVGPRGRGHAGRAFGSSHRRVSRRGPVARRRGSPRAGRARPGRKLPAVHGFERASLPTCGSKRVAANWEPRIRTFLRK